MPPGFSVPLEWIFSPIRYCCPAGIGSHIKGSTVAEIESMKRHRGWPAIAVAVVGVLAGCSAAPSPPATTAPGSDPATVAHSFLRAIADGNFATALSLSTSSASDFPCDGMVADGGDRVGLAAPVVTSVEVDGSSATAEVTYHAFRDVQETLDLDLVDGSWRVEIPESFRISLTFDAPTIAEVVIDDTCTVPVVGASADIVAWPGSYLIEIVDPTGVLGERFDEFLYMGTFDDGAMGTRDPMTLQAVPDTAFATVSVTAAALLNDAMDTCFASEFTDPSCPAGVVGADAPIDEKNPPITVGYVVLDRIWTDDGATWRFETTPATLSVSFDGVPTDVEFTTTGTLSVDNQDELVLTVDAP